MTATAAARFTHAACWRCEQADCNWSMSVTGSEEWLATNVAKELIESLTRAHMTERHPEVKEWAAATVSVEEL